MGYIACIKHGDPNGSEDKLSEKFALFRKSGNLKELGHFHYAAVQKIGDKTRVINIWTQEDFFPMQLIPEQGDAPGFDPVAISRPPSGRRMLSSGEAGEPGSLVIYMECQESVGELAGFYREDFARKGWETLKDDKDSEKHTFIVKNGSLLRIVSITINDGTRTVLVTTMRGS